MNKKGLTLVELLAVIAILSIILVIATPLVLNQVAKSKISAFRTSVTSIGLQAKHVVDNMIMNREEGVPEDGEYALLYVSDLRFSNDYDKRFTGFVLVANDNDNFYYIPYIYENEYSLCGIIYNKTKNEDVQIKNNSCVTTPMTKNFSISSDKVTTTLGAKSFEYIGSMFTKTDYNEEAVKDFVYKGSPEVYTVPEDGDYKIELWGAAGGGNTPNSSTSSRGGAGGYTSGIINLKKGEKLNVYVGGKGKTVSSGTALGGYNGGGDGSGGSYGAGGGGGATDIRLDTSLNSRIIVAGAGGGSDNTGGTYLGGDDGSGGAGGGLIAEHGFRDGVVLIPASGNGNPGTQTSGGDFGMGKSVTTGDLGGGGAGYYGGTNASGGNSGGGGGSSFISGYPGCNAIKSATDTSASNQTIHYSGKIFRDGIMFTGIQSMPNPKGGEMVGNIGDGYARITQLK